MSISLGTRTKRLAGLFLVVLLVGALAACGGDDDPSAGWSLPNGDLSNHRQADSEIDAGNADELGVAWTRDLTEGGSYGFFASTPLIADGTVYLHDLASNVIAVDLESGETRWTREYNDPVIGPNGLTLAEGVVYGVTSKTVFALDAASGEERWRRTLLPEEGGSLTIAPQAHDGRLFLSTITRPKGGAVYALDAATGRTEWTFGLLEDPASLPDSAAGGAWNTPLIDPEGSVYFGTGNPYITPRDGLENPRDLLYTNSTVKLDPASGRLAWHFQAVPNDFYDWDMQLSPIYVEEEGERLIVGGGKMGYVYAMDPDDGRLVWKRPVGRHNGHDDDSRRALEDPGSVTLDPPFQVLPGPYGGVETNMAYADGVVYAAVVNLGPTLTSLDLSFGSESGTFDFEGGAGEMVALDVRTGEVRWKTDLPAMPFGAATISNDLVFTTTFDGKLLALSRETGEIAWQESLPGGTNAPVAISGDTLVTAASYPQGRGQRAQVVAYRLGADGPVPATTAPATTAPPEPEASPAQIRALGKRLFPETCGSCHTLADAGASGTVAPNLDRAPLPAAAVADKVRYGGGGMPAFAARLSEAEIAAVAAYVAAVAGRGGGSGAHPPRGARSRLGEGLRPAGGRQVLIGIRDASRALATTPWSSCARPCPTLPARARRLRGFKVEVDALPAGWVCSASLKSHPPRGAVARAIAGRARPSRLLTKGQRRLFAAHAPRGIALDDLATLGPLVALRLTRRVEGLARPVTVERWSCPSGEPILELSTRARAAEALAAMAEWRAFLAARGIVPAPLQRTKTSAALELLAEGARRGRYRGGR